MRLATALCLCLLGVPSAAQNVIPPPTDTVSLVEGEGSLIRLGAPATNLFIADVCVADVQAVSPTLAFVTARGAGQTSFFALNQAEEVVAAYRVVVTRSDRRNPAIEGLRDGEAGAGRPADC